MSNPLENHYFVRQNDPERIFLILFPPPSYLGTTFWREGGVIGGGGVKSLCLVGFEPWSAKRLKDKSSHCR